MEMKTDEKTTVRRWGTNPRLRITRAMLSPLSYRGAVFPSTFWGIYVLQLELTLGVLASATTHKPRGGCGTSFLPQASRARDLFG